MRSKTKFTLNRKLSGITISTMVNIVPTNMFIWTVLSFPSRTADVTSFDIANHVYVSTAKMKLTTIPPRSFYDIDRSSVIKESKI